jgi:hypothetical protein
MAGPARYAGRLPAENLQTRRLEDRDRRCQNDPGVTLDAVVCRLNEEFSKQEMIPENSRSASGKPTSRACNSGSALPVILSTACFDKSVILNAALPEPVILREQSDRRIALTKHTTILRLRLKDDSRNEDDTLCVLSSLLMLIISYLYVNI